MKRETCNIEFITPCFLGGAQGTAEWRPASIRGQLRWWFRAVAGAACGGRLEQVRSLEDALFGTTGQSSAVRIRTDAGPAPIEAGPSPFGEQLTAARLASLWGDESEATKRRLRLGHANHEIQSDPISYLGFGPIVQGELLRPCLPAGSPGQFEIVWSRPVPQASDLFAKALRAWLDLGGIGARCRKGFGSLGLKEPDSRQSFEARVRELLELGRSFKATPDWTCFSSRSRVFIAAEGDGSWERAMARLGAWLVAFRRRYGYAGETRTAGTVPLANRDYEWASPKGTQRRQGIPDRAGFGLPLPFGKAETVNWDSPDGDARRASPLLLHVAKLDSRFFPVLTHLPAAFLPAGQGLRYKGRPGPARPLTNLQLDVVDRFLNDLAAKDKIQEVH